MSDGITVLDGTHLRAVDFSVPDSDQTITGARVLEIAESRASSSMFGLSLPETLKSSALKRIGTDAESFRSTELNRDQASSKLKQYVTAIADELKDDPIVVTILDGKSLRLFMADEDDFAMLAENFFTDLDTEDKGKLSKKEMRTVLAHMGTEMGIPPFSDFPVLNDILKKHGAEGDEELGQAQFAQLLQPILEEVSDLLSEKPVIVVIDIKIANGSKLRKILGCEKQMNDVKDKLFHEKHKDGERRIDIIRDFLVKRETELGLPPHRDDEVAVLYDEVFADVECTSTRKSGEGGSEKDELGLLVQEILEKFAEQLELNPIFHGDGSDDDY